MGVTDSQKRMISKDAGLYKGKICGWVAFGMCLCVRAVWLETKLRLPPWMKADIVSSLKDFFRFED